MAIVYSTFVSSMPLIRINDLTQTIALRKCVTDWDYENGLRELWGAPTDIVIVEHDIQATQAHVDELLECPYILCAFAYLVYPTSTGLSEAHWVHANRIANEYLWISRGDEWAHHAGLGLTKLSKLARREVLEWDSDETDVRGTWRNLDTRISRAFNDAHLKFHIHWPEVEHQHEEKR